MASHMAQSIVMLHGFGGTHRAWDAVVTELQPTRGQTREQSYRPLALDLPGHGSAAHVRPIDFSACVSAVLARAPARFALTGYSLGGRLALHVALAAPRRVSALVLVSSTAGIADERERARRRAADEGLAAELECGPFDQWVDRWRRQPLFAEDPAWVSAAARADQLRNDPAALAAALRGIGVGQMEPLWDRLRELRMRTVVLAGERDERYRVLGRELANGLVRGRLAVVPGGHALLFENPGAVATAIREAVNTADCPPPGR